MGPNVKTKQNKPGGFFATLPFYILIHISISSVSRSPTILDSSLFNMHSLELHADFESDDGGVCDFLIAPCIQENKLTVNRKLASEVHPVRST